MHVVVDASTLATLLFDEDGAGAIAERLDGARLHAPALLRFELANTALKKARRHPAHAPEIFARLSDGLANLTGITWHDVNPGDVALLAHVTGLSAYDASYVWLAGWLEANHVTLDKKLAAATGFASEADR